MPDESPEVNSHDRRIIYLIGCGLQTKEVGHALDLSAYAIDNHLRRLRAVLKVRTTAELVAYALSRGIIPPTHLGPQVAESEVVGNEGKPE
jgi:DNA-binding NarL/FixJ family response regulator